jgi:hypothetical protein
VKKWKKKFLKTRQKRVIEKQQLVGAKKQTKIYITPL